MIDFDLMLEVEKNTLVNGIAAQVKEFYKSPENRKKYEIWRKSKNTIE